MGDVVNHLRDASAFIPYAHETAASVSTITFVGIVSFKNYPREDLIPISFPSFLRVS